MNRSTRRSTRKRTAVKQAVKITPKPKFAKQGVDFADLDVGDFFLHENRLCVKRTGHDPHGNDQCGLDMADGYSFTGLCGTYVLPVNVEIKWTRK